MSVGGHYDISNLCGRDASPLTIPALKQWLQCRRAALTKGKKVELVEKYGSAIIRNIFVLLYS